jgi:hypothetical protein
MRFGDVEKTAVWVRQLTGSPMVLAARTSREWSSGEVVRHTYYDIVIMDEKRSRAMAERLLADEALSLAAFILLTVDDDEMPKEFKEKIRAWGKEILREGKPVELEGVPRDVCEGW